MKFLLMLGGVIALPSFAASGAILILVILLEYLFGLLLLLS
jgi:hypothetical protein